MSLVNDNEGDFFGMSNKVFDSFLDRTEELRLEMEGFTAFVDDLVDDRNQGH